MKLLISLVVCTLALATIHSVITIEKECVSVQRMYLHMMHHEIMQSQQCSVCP